MKLSFKVRTAAMTTLLIAAPLKLLKTPARAIGKNSIDSMQSGTVFGFASMIDGLCEKLEEELGTPLFLRSRPLGLTRDGKLFYDTAKEMLRLKQQYEESSSRSLGEAQFVHIGVEHTVARRPEFASWKAFSMFVSSHTKRGLMS